MTYFRRICTKPETSDSSQINAITIHTVRITCFESENRCQVVATVITSDHPIFTYMMTIVWNRCWRCSLVLWQPHIAAAEQLAAARHCASTSIQSSCTIVVVTHNLTKTTPLRSLWVTCYSRSANVVNFWGAPRYTLWFWKGQVWEDLPYMHTGRFKTNSHNRMINPPPCLQQLSPELQPTRHRSFN